MERRLSAIMAADIAGYSRLMGENEHRTLTALRAFRRDQFAAHLADHRGNLIKSMGDGWIVEFASIVDAINCAVAIQLGLQGHEFIKLRIGVHIGDIVHEDEDVFGDGINIAARLQESATPGGVAISHTVHDSVKGIIDHRFSDSGIKQLKNIDKQIRVFSWAMDDQPAPQNSKPARKERPIILVVPFSHSGSNDDHAWIAEGLTDALITALSRFSWFHTLPRNSSLLLKDKDIDVAELRQKLDVSYILDGSLRVAGNRVRINAQLIEAVSGLPIWTGQQDGTNDDPFELEDQISRSILAELTVRLLSSEQRKAKIGGDGSAWDLVMQGRSLLWHVNKADVQEAQALFLKAIKLEPDHGLGQSDLAWSYTYQRLANWGDDPDETIRLAIEAADKAVAADEYDAYALAAASQARAAAGLTEDSVALAHRAIEINPYLAVAYAPLALGLCQLGHYEQAIEPGDMALNINPNDPVRSIVRSIRGIYLFGLNRVDDMFENARELIREFPGMPTGYRQLAVAYAMSGRDEEAKQVVENHILRLMPGHTATESGRLLPFGNNSEIRRHWVEMLIKAGMPE
ncbi:MAG: adenylate/guanylate cyclase domain-containing protein [Rhizobiaceae bacterium]